MAANTKTSVKEKGAVKSCTTLVSYSLPTALTVETVEAAHAQLRAFSFSDHEFQMLASLANEITGIVLAEQKKDMVYSRLVRRLRALKLKSFADYCTLLQSDAGQDELGNLVNAITTNLTKFFREEHHFEHLFDEVLTPLVASKAKRLRIWSAGCSAGMSSPTPTDNVELF